MDDESIKGLDYFVDLEPKKQIEFYEAVVEGLSLPQKQYHLNFFMMSAVLSYLIKFVIHRNTM